MHSWGLRLSRFLRMLALAPPPVLPSAMVNDVGTPVAIISQLNTQPACTPVNASMAALRLATHDSGPGWIAIPFLYDSFIHNSTPVLSRRTQQPARRGTFRTLRPDAGSRASMAWVAEWSFGFQHGGPGVSQTRSKARYL